MMTAMFLVWKLWGKPDPSMAVNGMLAGLVAITAPCAFVAPWAAVDHRRDRRPAGRRLGHLHRARHEGRRPGRRLSVHGVNGLWGMIALGLFADGTYGAGFNGIAGAGHAACSTATASASSPHSSSRAWPSSSGRSALFYLFFKIQKATMGLRSSEADEVAGLDATEMGVLAYPDFVKHAALSPMAPNCPSRGRRG